GAAILAASMQSPRLGAIPKVWLHDLFCWNSPGGRDRHELVSGFFRIPLTALLRETTGGFIRRRLPATSVSGFDRNCDFPRWQKHGGSRGPHLRLALDHFERRESELL